MDGARLQGTGVLIPFPPGGGRDQREGLALFVHVLQNDQPVRIRQRECTQQHPVDDGEPGRGEPDPDREGEQGQRRGTGCRPCPPPGDQKVVADAVQPVVSVQHPVTATRRDA